MRYTYRYIEEVCTEKDIYSEEYEKIRQHLLEVTGEDIEKIPWDIVSRLYRKLVETEIEKKKIQKIKEKV